MQGDLASDFFAQIVPIFVPFVVIPFMLLGCWAIYRFYFKPAREKAKQQPTPETASPAYVQAPSQFSMPSMEEMTMSENPPKKSYDTGDLPPLDLLIEQPDATPEPPAPSPTPAPSPSPAQPIPRSSGANNVTLNTGAQVVGKEVITVLRDESDGRLMVKIGDTTYRTFTDSPDAKKEFSNVMKELSSVITQPDDNPPMPESVEEAPAEVEEADDMPSLGDLATPRQPKEYVAPPSLADGSMPGDLPSFKIDDNAVKVEGKRLGGTKVSAEPMPHLDIGAAIQTYVQWKIQHTPEYDGREIHIHATPSGMLRIQVDDKYYDAVADVEDVEVKEFLQHTIQEWQERQKR